MTTLMTMEHAADGAVPVDVANFSRRWWILAVLGVSQLMVILDGTIVNIALPTAQRDLHFSNADRQWIVTAYSLAFGSLLLLGGAFFLLRATLIAPSRVCPQCGGTERQAAGVLRRSQNLWLLHLGGWLVASLWGASRQQQVRCCQCETLYFTDTRATRIAGVLLWVFLLLILLGVLAETLKTR